MRIQMRDIATIMTITSIPVIRNLIAGTTLKMRDKMQLPEIMHSAAPVIKDSNYR
jgi:hypothetical protein